MMTPIASYEPAPDLCRAQTRPLLDRKRRRLLRCWFCKRSTKAPRHKGDTAMLTNSKIALSVALVLATASVAAAAPKHPVRHQTPTVQHAGAYLSFASASRTNSPAEPSYMKIQDQGIRDGDGY